MKNVRVWMGALGLVWGIAAGAGAYAQDARALVKEAVKTELAADASDQSLWRYRDEQKDQHTTSIVVETKQASVKRLVARNGQPLTGDEATAEQKRLEEFIHNPSKLAKQKKDGEEDDKNARELLTMLPESFTWTMGADAGETATLKFVPNPAFHPPDMQSRVLGAMSGEMVVDKASHRIRTIKGTLLQDVVIGYGLLGRLKQGGTFRVERRQVGPGIWQITETHVHISGRALLFKSIGQQQDEVQTEFTRVPEGTTLEQAVEMSKTTGEAGGEKSVAGAK